MAVEWNNKGNEFLREAKYEQALSCYVKSLALNSPTPSYLSEVLANKGTALYFLGRLDEALVELNSAIKTNSRSSYALALRGTNFESV